MAMFYAFALLCLFGSVFAQVPGFKSCPIVETEPQLDLTKYAGRWYENRRYFALFELGTRCVTADYTVGENGTLNMVHSHISAYNGLKISIKAVGAVPNAAESGKLTVEYPTIPFSPVGNYWVLGTDYDSYAVVYSCRSGYASNMKYAWILTREQNPDDSVVDAALEVAVKNQLVKSTFSKTQQTNCEEYNFLL